MIRKAVIEDALEINNIASSYDQNFEKGYNIITEVTNPQAIILVYELNQNILGFMYVLDAIDNFDLMYIATKKEERNKGIGSALLNYFINNYFKSIMLEVRVDNLNAINLYHKYNFKEINIRKGYYNGIDAIVMRRD